MSDVKMYDFPIDLSREDCRRLVAELHDKEAQLAEAQALSNDLENQLSEMKLGLDDAHGRIEELEANEAALREALEEICNFAWSMAAIPEHEARDNINAKLNAARAALATPNPGAKLLAVVEAAKHWHNDMGDMERMDRLLEALAALDGEGCQHEWFDPTNEIVDGNGYQVCRKCGRLEKGKE